MRQEARGAGGVQERVAAGAVGEERGWERKRRVAPWGYSREGAGKFFPLGCRQKGNYFNCGQPRSTKLHPVSTPSLFLSLFCSLSLSPCPRVRLLTLILSLSYAASRVLSFSPASFSFTFRRRAHSIPCRCYCRGFSTCTRLST